MQKKLDPERKRSAKQNSTNQVFDDLASMRIFAAIVDGLETEPSLIEAAKKISENYSSILSCFHRTRKKLETFYGIPLLDHRSDRSLTLPEDPKRLELLESIRGHVSTLDHISRDLQSCKAEASSPRVVIGSAPSVFSYLLPAVLKVAASQERTLKSDVEMFPGNRVQLEHMLTRIIHEECLEMQYLLFVTREGERGSI